MLLWVWPRTAQSGHSVLRPNEQLFLIDAQGRIMMMYVFINRHRYHGPLVGSHHTPTPSPATIASAPTCATAAATQASVGAFNIVGSAGTSVRQPWPYKKTSPNESTSPRQEHIASKPSELANNGVHVCHQVPASILFSEKNIKQIYRTK